MDKSKVRRRTKQFVLVHLSHAIHVIMVSFVKMVWKRIDVEFVLFPYLQSNRTERKKCWPIFSKTKQKLYWNLEKWRILWRYNWSQWRSEREDILCAHCYLVLSFFFLWRNFTSKRIMTVFWLMLSCQIFHQRHSRLFAPLSTLL